MPHFEADLHIDSIGSRNNILKKTYYCEYADLSILDSLDFKSGFSCDLLVKTLKWLFIEQDIRYWNYSGRDMLGKGIYAINH